MRLQFLTDSVCETARRRVAGEAGFDVTYVRRRSERRAVRPILLDADLEFAVAMHSTLFQSPLLSPHAGCHQLSELLSNQLLQKPRDKGNTVLVVEHDPDVIKVADDEVDVGPHEVFSAA